VRYEILMRFIHPARPTLRETPPRGDGWVHEVKFDGWRIQLHKHERGVSIFTRNGHDYAKRFPAIAGSILALPVRTCIIDGELTATNGLGLPDFRALHFRNVDERELCVWAFDLLHLDAEDLHQLPLAGRKSKLARLVYKTHKNWLRLSETFDHGLKLLASCEKMGLEGIVSKRRDFPYRSGDQSEWIKVKCHGWREANRNRHELFERPKRSRR
jgi:bifunctional non-homologous end joining protein LigD